MRGRAEPMNVIVADAKATAQRMRSDAERLSQLAEQAKHSLANAADHAVEHGAKALGNAIEAVATRAHKALDEFFGDVLGRAPVASPTPQTTPPRKALTP